MFRYTMLAALLVPCLQGATITCFWEDATGLINSGCPAFDPALGKLVEVQVSSTFVLGVENFRFQAFMPWAEMDRTFQARNLIFRTDTYSILWGPSGFLEIRNATVEQIGTVTFTMPANHWDSGGILYLPPFCTGSAEATFTTGLDFFVSGDPRARITGMTISVCSGSGELWKDGTRFADGELSLNSGVGGAWFEVGSLTYLYYPVPEPATGVMIGLAVVAAASILRRRSSCLEKG